MESKNVENKANVNVYNHCLEMPPKYFIPIKLNLVVSIQDVSQCTKYN